MCIVVVSQIWIIETKFIESIIINFFPWKLILNDKIIFIFIFILLGLFYLAFSHHLFKTHEKMHKKFPLFSYLPFHVITFHIHEPIAHKGPLVIVEFQSHESKI
jgi:hypothetical protein